MSKIKKYISNSKHVLYAMFFCIAISIIINSVTATDFNDETLSISVPNDVGINTHETLIPLETTINEKTFSNSISATNTDVIEIYIKLNHNEALQSILPHIKSIVDYDRDNSILVAKVNKNKINDISKLNGVISISQVIQPITYTGKYTTEGDSILLADKVRSQYKLTGKGIKVGVISDGVNHIADSQKTGDLPPNVKILSNSYGGDEGTAMLEIIHDIAPDAELYFHDCGRNKIAFNRAIDNLISAGCNIICDDVGWLTEPYFEDGIIANHISEITSSKNIIYISAAGNSANRHFQGNFFNRGDNFMDFSYGRSKYQGLYAQLKNGGQFIAVLQWDDKFGESSNNYDLYLYNADTGSIIASSETIQNGKNDPIETLVISNYGKTINVGIAVKKVSGIAKTIEIYGYNSPMYTNNIVSQDSIFGHPAIKNVVTVGAIYSKDTGYDTIESYSSQGDVTITYPYEIRQKPDICGIDGVSITGVGFTKPFYGTSAAAPHIAGICALAWSGAPSKTANDIRQALYSSAIDLGVRGKDPLFGYGRANAIELIKTLNIINPPTPTKTITPTPTKTPYPTKKPTPVITKTPVQTQTPIKPTMPVPTTKKPTPKPTLTKPTPRPTIPWF